MRTCKEITELASMSLDSSLPIMQRLELKLHLLMCNSCRNYMKQVAFIILALQKLDDKLPKFKLSEKAHKRIKHAIEAYKNSN